jgi:hypothetical protein
MSNKEFGRRKTPVVQDRRRLAECVPSVQWESLTGLVQLLDIKLTQPAFIR